jgi:hypothetical protein
MDREGDIGKPVIVIRNVIVNPIVVSRDAIQRTKLIISREHTNNTRHIIRSRG